MSDEAVDLDSCHDLIMKLRRRWQKEFGEPLWERTLALLFEKSSEWLSMRFCATKLVDSTVSSDTASVDALMDELEEEEEEFSTQSEVESDDGSEEPIADADILPG